MTRIHLLCDRCRAEGVTGDDPFADYAGLLDFDPVPRKPRADGWDAECQRAFIAALAACGSARQAAAAVGKAQYGVDNLKKAKGNESFMAAFESALDFFAQNRSLRLADGVRTASALAAHRHALAPRPAWSHAATRAHVLASSSAHLEPASSEAEMRRRETEPAPPVTAEARERLHAESFRRAIEGEEQPVFHGGVQVGTKRVFNDRLILHHLKEGEDGQGAGPGGRGPAMSSLERRIHKLLLENPQWTRAYAERRAKTRGGIWSHYPEPWRFGRQDDLAWELARLHEAFQAAIAADPERKRAFDLLRVEAPVASDFMAALGHAVTAFELLLPDTLVMLAAILKRPDIVREARARREAAPAGLPAPAGEQAPGEEREEGRTDEQG